MASGLLRASAVMASGTVVSRVLGLFKMMLLAFAIGSVNSRSADAFAMGTEPVRLNASSRSSSNREKLSS